MFVFIHGFLGSPADWDPITQGLEAPFKCLTLPGHCDAPLDLASFEKEIPEGSLLVGYSMGGRLAMQFAHKFPKKVGGLVILSANPGLETGVDERLIQDEKWATLLERDFDTFLDEWYAQPMFGYKRSRKGHDPKRLAKVLRTLSPAKLPNLWPHLKNFFCPKLFLFGENDIKYRLIGNRLRKYFEVVFVPDAGHAIHIEQPEVILNELSCRK